MAANLNHWETAIKPSKNDTKLSKYYASPISTIVPQEVDMGRDYRSYQIPDPSSGEDAYGMRSMCHGLPQLRKGKHIETYRYNDAPVYLQGNPYVTNGYITMLPIHLCVRSLFVWSNETINTWSHLVGFFIFLFMCAYDNAMWIPSVGGSYSDQLVISLGLVCFQFCMLCSAGYHLFRAHSEHANRRWLALDLTGISVGLLGCYLPGIHFGFYCLSLWRDIYLVIISIFFGLVFIYQTQPFYYSDSWFRSRLLLYCGLAGYGIVPAIHWIYLHGGLSSPIVQMFAPKILVVYLLGALAFACYITKFPERFFPGRFNYVGSSHQLWHLLVVMAFVWWHYSGQQLLLYRLQQPCAA